MYQVTQLLATIGPLLLIALKFGLVIGGTGSLLEAIGNWRNWPALVAIGQKLEAIGADIPKLVGRVQTLLPPPYTPTSSRPFPGSDPEPTQVPPRAALIAANTVRLGSLQRRTACFTLIGGRQSLMGLALIALLLAIVACSGAQSKAEAQNVAIMAGCQAAESLAEGEAGAGSESYDLASIKAGCATSLRVWDRAK